MEPKLINPSGQLLPELESQMFYARKTKPLWAKQLTQDAQVETLEGTIQAKTGDYLCRGTADEFWPQKPEKLLGKYQATGKTDGDGFQLFTPRPDSPAVQACQTFEFVVVNSQWGEFKGKPKDYVVRSTTDQTEIWIVEESIFEATYERVETG
jgi:hypothetical protein